MTSDEDIRLLEKYAKENAWVALARTGDGSPIITGVPIHAHPLEGRTSYRLEFHPYLSRPRGPNRDLFDIVDKTASIELSPNLTISIVGLTGAELADMVGERPRIGF